MRQTDWKLIYFHESQQFEMYNTKQDIGEKNNLFHVYPVMAKKLAAELGSYLKKAKSQMPKVKKTGKMVLYPDDAFRQNNK